ncbi:ribosome maturation factor RimP [Eggerthellaceae bacterium zg-893]|nr:ribosome maturation factor RimP [Eggerthellaceae bacterium zg-893]
MLTGKERSLLEALEPSAAENGVEIVTVSIIGSKKAPTVRVYIDTPGGVSFDELTAAQAWIDETIEAIDPFPGAYTIEVSSPGIDRPLRTLDHFKRFVGDTAKVKLVGPLDGRAIWTGVIEAVEGDVIVLRADEAVVQIPFANIKGANLKGVVDFSKKD